MEKLKYLNIVLTVIATCLVVITSSIIGLIPSAHAQTVNGKNAKVNDDGSINVRIVRDYKSTPFTVNLTEVSGFSIGHSAVPVVVLAQNK